MVREDDGPDRTRSRGVWLVTDGADRSRIRFPRRDGRVFGVRCKRTVAGLAADACVRVVLARILDVRVALDAGALAGIGRRSRGDLHERTSPVAAEAAIIRRNEQRPQDGEDKRPSRKHCGKPKEMLVRSKGRHDAHLFGKRGAGRDTVGCCDFSRPRSRGANYSAETRKIRLMIVVLMGAAGAGKTTVGKALAHALGWTFLDADDLHGAANVEKIHSGVPLTDADRAPWLARTHDAIATLARHGGNAVVACSALRERYRATLSHGVPDLRWVFLEADRGVLAARLHARAGHFAGPEILDSQLRELERPRHVLTLRADLPVKALVDQICNRFALTPAHRADGGA